MTRRERWGLSWRGWVLIFVFILSVGWVALLHIYPFLAVTHRVDANVLVVEGWVQEYAMRTAVNEFRTGSYQRVFTTGGPVVGSGGYINDYNTSASVGADFLKKIGLPDESVQMVPSRVMDRDRTYRSAVTLRDWLREHKIAVRGLNIVTEGTHARRTQAFFNEALGRNTQVGVISVPSPDYDPRHWWRYSEGIKDVISELAAYLYAKCLFYPFDLQANHER